MALNSPQYLHLVSEIEKRVFADRAEYLGDPDFVKVPGRGADRPRLHRPPRPRDRPGQALGPGRREAGPGPEKPQTTHFSIVDRWGNAVSNTYTLNGWFGSGVVVEGAGFLLNDEMDDFSAKPGAPNQFGVVGGDANAIAPGKRPLSSMTPTILTKDGRVAMVIGTPGGSRIFTSVFQVLADVYDFDLPLPKALAQLASITSCCRRTPSSPSRSRPCRRLHRRHGKRGYRIDAQDFNGDIEAIQVIGGRRRPRPIRAPAASRWSSPSDAFTSAGARRKRAS